MKTSLEYIKSINNLIGVGIRLQNISTGADVPQDGLLECMEISEKSHHEYVESRFQDKEKHLDNKIPTDCKTVFMKRTYTLATVTKSMAKKDAVETIRYISYVGERGYTILELLKYELSNISLFLATECKYGI